MFVCVDRILQNQKLFVRRWDSPDGNITFESLTDKEYTVFWKVFGNSCDKKAFTVFLSVVEDKATEFTVSLDEGEPLN